MIVRVTYEVELPKGTWTYDTESREMAYGNMTRQEALDFDFADPYALIEAAEAGAVEITGADVVEVES